MNGSRAYLWVVAFVSGMSVMAVEMTASRLVAPYFGTSLFVWANVIGMIMAALAVGYWVGGKFAERSPKLQTLLWVLLAAAVLSALIPLFVAPFSRIVITQFLGATGALLIALGSFLTLLVLFAVPIFLMGMTSPFLIKLLSSHKGAGETAGGVFALSTVGSLAGTFLPAFLFVPTIGSRATVLLFAGVLLAIVVLGLLGKRAGILSLAVFLAVPWAARTPVHAAETLLAETESPYQYIQILEKDGARILRFNEGLADQSVEYADTPFTGRYWDTIFPLPNLTRAAKPKVLILGLATGTIARGIIETREPGAVDVTGVEIDQKVVDFGRSYFSLDKHPEIHIVVEDGRTFLERTDEQYDMILVDAYANQLYIPFHMATEEFFALAKSRLHPGGILVANVNAPSRTSPLVTSIAKTIGASFPYVDAYHVPQSWNRVLVASDAPIDWDGATARMPDPLKAVFADVQTLRDPIDTSTGTVLTDDKAPVELMTDAMIFDAFRSGR